MSGKGVCEETTLENKGGKAEFINNRGQWKGTGKVFGRT